MHGIIPETGMDVYPQRAVGDQAPLTFTAFRSTGGLPTQPVYYAACVVRGRSRAVRGDPPDFKEPGPLRATPPGEGRGGGARTNPGGRPIQPSGDVSRQRSLALLWVLWLLFALLCLFGLRTPSHPNLRGLFDLRPVLGDEFGWHAQFLGADFAQGRQG